MSEEEYEHPQDSFDRVFLAGVAGHARSQQRKIGPSGLGTPCPRKLAYQLAQMMAKRHPESELRQTIGTATHSWVENTFTQFGGGDWLTETRVSVGSLTPDSGEVEIEGTSDLYHIPSKTVVDLKVPGVNSCKNMKLHGMSQTYLVQLMLYGQGYRNLGYEVQRVALAAVPAGGEWKDRVWLEADFDEKIVKAALARATKILNAIEKIGFDTTLSKLEPVDDYCRRCEWARPADGYPVCQTVNERKIATNMRELLRR